MNMKQMLSLHQLLIKSTADEAEGRLGMIKLQKSMRLLIPSPAKTDNRSTGAIWELAVLKNDLIWLI